MISKFLVKPLAAAALLVVAGASQAAITVYNSLATFTAAVGTTGTDTYTGFSIVGSTPSPIIRSAGPFSYTADTTPAGTFFGAGTTANPWLSTNTATDTITFNTFSGGVVGVGGNFFGSTVAGTFTSGNISVIATDASGSSSQTILAATTGSFLGFVSNGPMTSLTVCVLQTTSGVCGSAVSGFIWPTVDNLVLASAAAPVPEPQTYAMLLAGLGFVGFMARRRRG